MSKGVHVAHNKLEASPKTSVVKAGTEPSPSPLACCS